MISCSYINRLELATIALTLGIATITASAQQTVEGSSVQLRLEDLVPSDAGAEKLQGLASALDELGVATNEALQKVREARIAYEQNPNGETEAGLFNANAAAIRGQYETLGGVMEAARDARGAMDELRSDAVTAEGTFAEQVGTTKQARQRAAEVVVQIEGRLEELAANYDEIVGPDGQIEDEELEIAVLQAAAGRDYAEIVTQLATGDSQAALADLKDLGEVSLRLRRQQGRLRVIAMRAHSQRAALAMVARSQIERMKRRGVLLRAVDFLKWTDGLNADGLIEGRPVIAMPTPGGSVLTDYGVPEDSGRSGADILREVRDKAGNSHRPSLTNSTSEQTKQH